VLIQPFTVVATEIVPVIGEIVALVAVKEAIFPKPQAPNPIAVFEFVHANVPPPGVLVKEVAETVAPLQIEKLEGIFATG
jgi:hypothetical protein